MKANDISRLPFEAKEIGNGKGKGLIASRDIEAGEVIVTEEPLLVVYSSDNKDILEELVDATKEVKARIMKLSDLGDADLGCTEFFSTLETENAKKELEVLMRKFRSNMLHAPGGIFSYCVRACAYTHVLARVYSTRASTCTIYMCFTLPHTRVNLTGLQL